MKSIHTYVEDELFKRFEKTAKRMGKSNYKAAQFLIEKALDDQHRYEVAYTIGFWFFCYALIATVLLLINLTF